MSATLHALKAVAHHVVGAVEALAKLVRDGVVAIFNAVVVAGKWLYEHLTTCPQPPPVKHPKGSGNGVMVVGGLGSSRHTTKSGGFSRSVPLDMQALGYSNNDVAYFSYSADSATYNAKDTYGDLHSKARLLGEQLKAYAAAHPGRAVDLVAHSQGGVIVDLFLMDVYRGHENEYPRIKNVVTFASPHLGTPLASLEKTVDQHLVYGAITDAAANGLPIGATAVSELAEGSATIFGLWFRRTIPSDVRFLSIMGSEDPFVPSTSGFVPGDDRIVVPVGDTFVPDDHSAILDDDDAISAAQAQLSGGHPADTCGFLVDVGSTLYSTLVRAAATSIALSPGELPDVVSRPKP